MFGTISATGSSVRPELPSPSQQIDQSSWARCCMPSGLTVGPMGRSAAGRLQEPLRRDSLDSNHVAASVFREDDGARERHGQFTPIKCASDVLGGHLQVPSLARAIPTFDDMSPTRAINAPST